MGDVCEEGAGVEVLCDGHVAGDAKLVQAPDADDVAGYRGVWAERGRCSSPRARVRRMLCRQVHMPMRGKQADPRRMRVDVRLLAGEGLMAGHSAVGGVDQVEPGLGLGATLHVGLSQHEVEVGAHCVGECEGSQAPDVGLGEV